jgi:hypothetical protein
MPRVGFEHTTLVFERVKTVHTLDRADTVINFISYNNQKYKLTFRDFIEDNVPIKYITGHSLSQYIHIKLYLLINMAPT